MKSKVNEHERWSPFSPEWYQKAFDRSNAVSEQLFNSYEIIKEGYVLPDNDGSRSSAFRADAVTNNSFNENALRESLKDIYLNNSNRLIASNHDNTHFYSWTGHMSDTTLVPNTKYCEIILPTETFISAKGRDKYKLSQYFRKWIPIGDIHNNWDTFKWDCLLFVDGKIYSDYIFRIDDQQTIIRFKYEQFWLDENPSIYIYKFDTNAQCRVKVAFYQVNKQWVWKVPVDYLDPRVAGNTHVIAYFNRIGEGDRDDHARTNVMGDNLEFLEVKDGYIDISHISSFNRGLINNELVGSIWMTVIVPKFLHEYPILLATDVLFRPYQPNLVPVVAQNVSSEFSSVKTDNTVSDSGYNVYVNLDSNQLEWTDGWQYAVRPIVLADAFDHPEDEPYEEIWKDLSNLRDLTIKGADLIEEFYDFMESYTTDEEFIVYCDRLEDIMQQIHECHNGYLQARRIDLNKQYEDIYARFKNLMVTLRQEKDKSVWFHQSFAHHNDFWNFISPLIWIPRELADKYYVAWLIHVIGPASVWEPKDEFLNQQRFRRPVEVSDFWIFEYDQDKNCWRPTIMNIEHHFPDVYTLKDPNEETPTPNRIFKAFFFYSDTMNVREISGDIVHPTQTWDEDIDEYKIDKQAVYRDIFMEKFYWMGVQTIYKGLIQTKHRWEMIEYIQDNASYQRFNDLFLHTMDPYYKLGLSTYMKSDNFEFPFDDAIAKMNEAITQQFLGYTKITNFEIYLNKTWIPSYFDYVTRILDDWEYQDRLVRRPRDSFDVDRVMSVLDKMQDQVHNLTDEALRDLQWILDQIKEYGYNIPDSFLLTVQKYVQQMADNIEELNDFTNNLDLDIYSIEDVNHIRDLIAEHQKLIDEVEEALHQLRTNNPDVDKVKKKIEILTRVRDLLNNELYDSTNKLAEIIQTFDIDTFMHYVCDPEFLDERNHIGDDSLIGYMNQFKQNWELYVQVARDKLYTSVIGLWNTYNPNKKFSSSEIDDLLQLLYINQSNLANLTNEVQRFWKQHDLEPDDKLVSLLAYATAEIDQLKADIEVYIDERKKLLEIIDEIRALMLSTEECGLSDKEETYMSDIDELLEELMESLSYLAGAEHKKDAYTQRMEAWTTSKEWLEYAQHELEVYEEMLRVSEDPNPYMDSIHEYSKYMDALAEYLKTLDREYVPDDKRPDYTDVYEVDEVELLTGGFYHAVGDQVYVPNLGSYEVSEIEDNVQACTSVIPLNYRKTTFADPMWQHNPFDSITDGEGLGITFIPKSSKRTPIINDTIIDRIVARIKYLFKMIEEDVKIVNPFNNTKMNANIRIIEEAKAEWENTLELYDEHMSDLGKWECERLVDAMAEVPPILNELIANRTRCDIAGFISQFDKFIRDSYNAFDNAHMITPTYVYYDGRMRALYQKAINFYGNGSTWNDKDELKKVVDDCIYELKLFYRKMLYTLPDSSNKTSLEYSYNTLLAKGQDIEDGIVAVESTQAKIAEAMVKMDEIIAATPPDIIIEHWYNLNSVLIGEPGYGYKVGDILKILPEVQTDINGTILNTDADTVLDDVLLIRITQVDEHGSVLAAVPLLSYALPYQIWGARSTEPMFGNGSDLVINAYTEEVDVFDSPLFMDPESDIIQPDRFDRNDLFMFKFENIHDLDMNYEVFLNGKQKMNFVLRHLPTENPLHPENIDIIYLNANEVYNLRNSAIEVEDEHHFIYQLDSVELLDPGKGYAVGQTIVVDSGPTTIKLQVKSLKPTPFKEIESVDVIEGNTKFIDIDPTTEEGRVVPDSLNNIDDEFNVGYYDQITEEGITKDATFSYGPEYPFTSKRFDNLLGDDRNEKFMYPTIEMPTTRDFAREGDPDGHWYLGSRENYDSEDHWFNGINNVIPPTDPFIPREDRIPPGQPTRGEYQLIDEIKIHTTDATILTGIADYEIEELVAGLVTPDPDQPSFDMENHDISIDEIQEETIQGLIDNTVEAEASPTVVVDGETIKAVDTSDVRGLIYGSIEPGSSPPPFIDECIVNADPNDKGSVSINDAMTGGDLVVPNKASMPQHVNEWPEAAVGKTVIVEQDESMGNHRTLYRLRTFLISGYLVYDTPELADWQWNKFTVDWLKDDWYPDMPSLNAQYPTDQWYTSKSYREMEEAITDNFIHRAYTPRVHQGTYIHELTVDDLSVYNFTLHQWEDLHDDTRWKLTTYDEEGHYGFDLEFLGIEDNYSYNMRLYLNKIPANLNRNAALKADASFKVQASVESEVNTRAGRYSINTGRHLRIRKLFPYEQKSSGKVGITIGRTMEFKLANYMHYKNEIHAEDIVLYNKTAGRYEDVLDPRRFELQFKDDKAWAEGYETQTTIAQSMIAESGEGFVDGIVWCYNNQRDVHLFGRVTADSFGDGGLMSFTPIHCPNPPKEDITLEFKVYQYDSQRKSQAGTILVEFQTMKVEVRGNGYLRRITNPLAPVPNEFRIVAKYDPTGDFEYEMRISKTPKKWVFIENEWKVFPIFYIDERVPADRIYIVTNEGRIPLVNPSTGKPSFMVSYYDDGMDVTFLNIYKQYEQLEIHSTPYPMRSVYTQRRVPQSGYIDLDGKINKPLNKKYFEFWMNGRLLNDEVTIISPTKIFLHGLTSLRNFEIIEINRDSNEYFADNFLGVGTSENGRPYPKWNYNTYLDDALEGTLDGDNYRLEEQESLLTPVWKQVERDHPEYKNFPPNRDLENDILLRVDDYADLATSTDTAYQFAVIDPPSIEDVQLNSQNTTFEAFGFEPITDDEIIDMLNEEWKEEIEEGLIQSHAIISEDEYYGLGARMYDEYGSLVNSLDESAYVIISEEMLRINHADHEARIITTNPYYDLT